jgi:hypothetical protein
MTTLEKEIRLVTLYESPDKYEWWLNELRSLGLEVDRRNEFNDIKEISSLVNGLKESYYVNYQNSSSSSD